MTSIQRLAGVALAGVLAIVLSACGGSEPPAEGPSNAPSAGNEKLRIGISFDQPGLGLKDGTTYSGFDVDTAIYVARALGVTKENITWVEARPADREKLITSGQTDLVLSTYTITEERRQLVDFAGPYFLAHQDLLIRRNDEDITGPETLEGRKLCSVTGTTSAARVKDQYRGTINLVEYPKFSDCVVALADGKVDVVSTDDVILAGFAAVEPYKGDLRVLGKGFSDEYYGVGIKKGDTEMVQKVNAALKEYIADGSWKKALATTVGPSGYRIPAPPTPGS